VSYDDGRKWHQGNSRRKDTSFADPYRDQAIKPLSNRVTVIVKTNGIIKIILLKKGILGADRFHKSRGSIERRLSQVFDSRSRWGGRKLTGLPYSIEDEGVYWSPPDGRGVRVQCSSKNKQFGEGLFHVSLLKLIG